MDKKCVLITGAVKNSGYGIARRFLKEGWVVFITSRDIVQAKECAKALSEEFQGTCIGLEYLPLEAKTDTERLFKEIEKTGYTLDTLVCAAADLGRFCDPLTVEPEVWENTLLTNVMGYYMPCRETAKQMIKSGKAKRGTIVLISSINYRDALPERSAYVTSKGAICSMTKALAIDFGKYGIRVNCIAPGPIWTDRYDKMDKKEAEERAKFLPIGRVTTIEQMGNMAYFLASEESDNMTGSVVIFDGGMDCLNAF